MRTASTPRRGAAARCGALLLALIAVLLAPAVPAAHAADTAPAERRYCEDVTALGARYPVRVLKGGVHCATARRTLRSALAGARSRVGSWTCFFGHGQDPWSATCFTGRESRPRSIVRDYNPS